jgi:alpha-D-xyloside xylohydrolase
VLGLASTAGAQVLGDPIDVSQDFQKMEQVYFVGNHVVSFDTATGQGTLEWARYVRNTTLSFNKVDIGFARGRSTEFPGTEYDENPRLPFSITFSSPRAIRIRISTHAPTIVDAPSLMLVGDPPRDNSWRAIQDDKAITYTSAYGRVVITKNPWHIEFYDAA